MCTPLLALPPPTLTMTLSMSHACMYWLPLYSTCLHTHTHTTQGPWSVVVMMIGINDLLRGGKPAQDIMDGLAPMIDRVLATRTPVILMPPFAAPGFVQE